MSKKNDFFEETLKGLKQAVQIAKGETGTVEVKGMPAKTYRALNGDDVNKAHELAKELFADKVDLAGEPYINHPEKVAGFVETDTEKVVAYLHDVLEDTDYPEEKMRTEFGDFVTDTVKLLTHEEGLDREGYLKAIQKIKDSENEVAIRVKLADLTHNTDISRLGVGNVEELSEKDRKRYDKYQEAIRILKA